MTSSDPPSSFEQSLAELERILRALEDGSITLEQSLAHYERGVALVAFCHQQLRNAEQRILLLSSTDAEGGPNLTTFQHAATVEAVKPEKRRTRKPDTDGTLPFS